MSLLKLIVRIGQGALSERGMNRLANNWMKMKAVYKKNMTPKNGINTLNPMGIHERNGSRGNGIGMGHRTRLYKPTKPF